MRNININLTPELNENVLNILRITIKKINPCKRTLQSSEREQCGD